MTRSHKTGFVIPSQNEWIKAAYYDPSGGGNYSYWKYPTNPGVFGDDAATAPQHDHARPDDRRRHQRLDPAAGELPRLRSTPAPSWCPSAFSRRSLRDRQPLRDRRRRPTKRPTRAASSTVGQAQDHLALGHARPGRQRGRVDRHDHRRRRSGARARPGLAPAARRHRQRPRLPALALGGRPAAAGQHLLHRHLSVAGHPHRRARQPEAGQALSQCGVRGGGIALAARAPFAPSASASPARAGRAGGARRAGAAAERVRRAGRDSTQPQAPARGR